MGCHALLQGIFPTQGSKLCLLKLLHYRHILYQWVTGEAPKTIQIAYKSDFQIRSLSKGLSHWLFNICGNHYGLPSQQPPPAWLSLSQPFSSLPLEPCISQVLVFSLCSHVWLFAAPWTVAYQAPLSLGFSRQECWNGLPFPPPGDFPNSGIKSVSLRSPALAGRLFTISTIQRAGKPSETRDDWVSLQPERWILIYGDYCVGYSGHLH